MHYICCDFESSQNGEITLLYDIMSARESICWHKCEARTSRKSMIFEMALLMSVVISRVRSTDIDGIANGGNGREFILFEIFCHPCT